MLLTEIRVARIKMESEEFILQNHKISQVKAVKKRSGPNYQESLQCLGKGNGLEI